LEQMRKNTSDPSKVPRIHQVEKWYISPSKFSDLADLG
jgi:hypothetical protein